MEIYLKVFDQKEDLHHALAEEMALALFYGGTACLAGGTSPERAYRIFAGQCNIPWTRVTLIPSDERCYPPGHPERNDNFLKSIFRKRECRILSLTSKERPDRIASSLSSGISSYLPFGITILGLGEDGHTASLFPGDPALGISSLIIKVNNSPKPPKERVSLSIEALNRSKKILFCVTGAAKREALRSLMNGSDIPASRLDPECRVTVFADHDAAR